MAASWPMVSMLKSSRREEVFEPTPGSAITAEGAEESRFATGENAAQVTGVRQ